MRMFLSISGHSNELSIANHSSRPTVSQLKCVSDTISKRDFTTEDKNLHRHLRSFPIQNSNQMASRLTATTNFPRVFVQLLQVSRQRRRPSFSAHRAALMTKPVLIFAAFSSKCLNFTLQFCFRCKFSFHEEQRSSQV